MHIVDALELLLQLARRHGYRIRREWLDGSGGCCEIRGQKFLFLDVSQAPDEQFETVLDALRHDPNLAEEDIPAQLQPGRTTTA